MMARRLLWILFVSLAATACDTSFLHKVKSREPATDTTCAPDAPAQNLAAEVSPDHVTLTWTSEAGNEDGFVIERATDTVPFGDLTTRAATDETSFDDAGITLGEVYQYRVSAYRAVNGEECRTAPTPAVEAVMYPAAVVALSFEHLSASDLVLTFDDPNKRPTGYQIERQVAGAPTFALVADLAPPNTPYSDWGLTPDSLYTYRVTVKNLLGASPPFEATVFTAQLPQLAWTETPYVGPGCELVLPGRVTFDTAAQPPAAFASASGQIPGCTGVHADAHGLWGLLTYPASGDAATEWTVADNYGATGHLSRHLTLSSGDTARGLTSTPTSEAPYTVGRQPLLSTCGACTGAGPVSLALGNAHTCILNSTGDVSCWGRNESGELGTGGVTSTYNPIDACLGGSTSPCSSASNDLVQIAHGHSHVCAVTTSGTVKCWGANAAGQLGDGSRASRGYPVEVCASGYGQACPKLTGIRKVAVGYSHTCAIVDATGGVLCWGANGTGELGRGRTDLAWSPLPAAVCLSGTDRDGSCAPLEGAVDLSLGGQSSTPDPHDFACAAMDTGEVFCWGSNSAGQLGGGIARYDPSSTVSPTVACDPTTIACSTTWTGVTSVALGHGPYQTQARVRGGSSRSRLLLGQQRVWRARRWNLRKPRPSRAGLLVERRVSTSVGDRAGCHGPRPYVRAQGLGWRGALLGGKQPRSPRRR